MTTYMNPRNGDMLETEIPQQDALAKLATLQNDFAQSLCEQWRNRKRLSDAQWYWVYKLAFPKVNKVQLVSNLEEFCKRAEQLVFNWEHAGKVRVVDGKVFSGHQFCGKLTGDVFEATENCPPAIIQRITLFAIDPMRFLQSEGRRTGTCCVCGITLTNPESIALGIGPICRSKW